MPHASRKADVYAGKTNIRQLTDVLQCKLHQYLRYLTSSSAPPGRGPDRPDRRMKETR